MEKIYQLHHEEYNQRRQIQRLPIQLLLDNIIDYRNIGSMLRLADALAVEKVWLGGWSELPHQRLITRTARGNERHVDWQACPDLIHQIQALSNEGYTVIALEITNQSHDIRHFDFKKYPRMAIVVGKEDNGISPEVLAAVDLAIEIPMLGMGSSMNVATSLGICLFEIVRQLTT